MTSTNTVPARSPGLRRLRHGARVWHDMSRHGGMSICLRREGIHLAAHHGRFT